MWRTKSDPPDPAPWPTPVSNEMIFSELDHIRSLINDLIGKIAILSYDQQLGFENMQKKLQDNNDRTVITMHDLAGAVQSPPRAFDPLFLSGK